VEAEVRWKRKDGSVLTLRLKGRGTTDGGGNVTGFEMMVEDVSRSRELEAQLRQAQKMEAIGRLTGGIAHDFNNELSVILLNAQLAAVSLEQGQAVQPSDLHDIEDAAQRAADMTRELLGFSRQAELALVPTDLARVVSKLSSMLRRLLPESISLRFHADGPVPSTEVDVVSVEQMLLNIATNARDAMPDGGTLTVRVDEITVDEDEAAEHAGLSPGAYVCLSASDTGVGMDEQTRQRIFEPFFTTKEPEVGTGLGMAMVYGLTKQQGGYVSVYSEPGRGTTIRLHFPACDQEAAEVRVRDSAAHVRGGTETVLLVEDEAALRRAARRILERYGYTVLTATSGKDALEVYDRQRDEIALVVSDLVMPEMGGWSLYKALRAKYGDVAFILSSGYTGRDAKERDKIDPTIPFVRKPWRITDLVARVRRVLDARNVVEQM
ncbi:MAG: ATP-binding protein, partial [Gemmatimonadales bacterium]